MITTILGAIFIIIAGTLFHFVYEWSHHNKLIGFFTAVNESTWEHLKLLIAPSYLWLIVECLVYSGNQAVFLANFLGLLAGLILIPLIFYGYSAIFKKDILALDILSFILAAVLEQAIFHTLLQILPQNDIVKNLGIAALVIMFIIYLTQTYAPTKTFLSRDPITQKYGIAGHWHAKKAKQKSRSKKR